MASIELFELAQDELDNETLASVADDALGLESGVAALEFRRMFSNPADPLNKETP